LRNVWFRPLSLTFGSGRFEGDTVVVTVEHHAGGL